MNEHLQQFVADLSQRVFELWPELCPTCHGLKESYAEVAEHGEPIAGVQVYRIEYPSHLLKWPHPGCNLPHWVRMACPTCQGVAIFTPTEGSREAKE